MILNVDTFYNQKWSSFVMQPHVHGPSEFMQVIRGKATVNIFDENLNLTKKYELTNGDIIFINSNTTHQLHIEDEQICHIINLEVSNLHGNIYNLDIPKSKEYELFIKQKKDYFCFSDKYGNISDYFFKLINELELSQKNNNLTSYEDALLYVFFSEFLREYYINFSQNYVEHDYVKSINKYIDDNFLNQICIDEISNFLCLNKSYMQKLYKMQTGETIGNYLTRKRLQRACFLIENTNMSFYDIALEVGFNSRQGLSKAFKLHYNKSAKEFRKKS